MALKRLPYNTRPADLLSTDGYYDDEIEMIFDMRKRNEHCGLVALCPKLRKGG